VGGTETKKVDVRIIAATNRDMDELLSSGQFRRDLWFRLNVFPIVIPPLRERRIDIPELANYIVLKKSKELNLKTIPEIPVKEMNRLLAYDWPGNVREMENLIEMLVVMKENGAVTLEDLPNKIHKQSLLTPTASHLDLPEEGIDFNKMLIEYERDLILKALNKCGGVKNKAAKMLNLKRTTLVEKLKRL